MKNLTGIILALISAILLALSFPPFDYGPLAWVALVPLLVAISGRSAGQAFLLGMLAEVPAALAIGAWITVPDSVRWVEYGLMGFYVGLYAGLFSMACALLHRHRGLPFFLLAPVFWVALEFIRANIPVFGLPLGQIGHTQYQQIELIQIASITGVYGISYLVVMVNGLIADLILSRGQVRQGLIAPVVTFVVIFLFGYFTLESRENIEKDVAVATIQPNIPQDIKWDHRYQQENLEKLFALTRTAAGQRASKLVVWPEASVPSIYPKDYPNYQLTAQLARDVKTPILMGTSARPKFGPREVREATLYNSALLVNRDGGITDRYNKIHLLPFYEYLPGGGNFPWPAHYTSAEYNYTPGDEYKVFEVEGGRFSTLICWEVYFPGATRRFVKAGAEFLVNMTNEGWFEDSAASHQLWAILVFRAVENGRSIVRSANTGISGVIDPRGRIIDTVNRDGQQILVEGYLVEDIPLNDRLTIYTRVGDLFAMICVFGALVLIPFAWATSLRISD